MVMGKGESSRNAARQREAGLSKAKVENEKSKAPSITRPATAAEMRG
jgi:hypothetical protein